MTKRTVVAGSGLAAILLTIIAYTQLRERRVIRAILTPDQVTLTAGGTQRFQAYGLLSTGDTVVVRASFRATGGEITADGLYSAGAVAGAYQVTATLLEDDYEVLEFDSDDEVEDADDDDDEIRPTATAAVTVNSR